MAYLRAIYEEGIATGVATFETDIPEWPVWDEEHLGHSRFVATSNNDVTGWIALAPVSGRCAYNGVAEISIYITGLTIVFEWLFDLGQLAIKKRFFTSPGMMSPADQLEFSTSSFSCEKAHKAIEARASKLLYAVMHD